MGSATGDVVHVDPATLTYVLIDIEGRVRQYARRRTLQARRPEQVVAAIADQVTQLVTAAGIEPGRPEQVKPIYLRRPDAEVWRERGHRDRPDGRR